LTNHLTEPANADTITMIDTINPAQFAAVISCAPKSYTVRIVI
jgi:hypothetical protein